MSSGDPTKISSQPPPENGARADNEQREAAELTIGSAAPLLMMEDLPPTKRRITKAEKWFDTGLYGGFMGIFNAVYSVWLADEVKEGRGKAFFEKSSDWLGRNVAAKLSSAPLEQNIKRIKNFNVMLALCSAGIMLTIPMKWVENRKPAMVRWIYEKFTKPNDPELAAKDEAALKQLDETPILGWGPIITGRGIGMIAPFGVAWYGTGFVHGVETVGEKLGTAALRSNAPHVKRYSRMMSAELLYTALCTAGLYIYTHFVKPPKKEAADVAASTPEAQDAAPSAAAPLSADSKDCKPCRFKPMKNYAEMVSTHTPADAGMEAAP